MTMTRTPLGASPTQEPSPVATPLPPRNFSHTGEVWPRIAKKAAVAASTYGGSTQRWPTDNAIATGTNPFRASSTRVAMPRAGDFRDTLSAPLLTARSSRAPALACQGQVRTESMFFFLNSERGGYAVHRLG